MKNKKEWRKSIEAAAQEKAERTQALQSKVTEIANNFKDSPEQLTDYLRFTSRFYKYSPRNVRLIYAQNPGAKFVATFNKFKDGLPDKDGNRLIEEPINIKKGERAIYIWKPVERIEFKTSDGIWKMPSELTESEKNEYKANRLEKRTITGFTLYPVFDVTQTDLPSDKYPKLFAFGSPSATADTKIKALCAYSENVLQCPVKIENFGGMATSTRGRFIPFYNTISISDKLSGDEKLSSLIHEIGHASLHASELTRNGKTTAQRELEADMYALLLQDHLGLPITESRKSHLATHYRKWLSELPEDQRADINADLPIFDRVVKRYGETIDDIDSMIASYNGYSIIDQAQEIVPESIVKQSLNTNQVQDIPAPVGQMSELPHPEETFGMAL